MDNLANYQDKKDSEFVNEFKNYLINKNRGNSLDRSQMENTGMSQMRKTLESNQSAKIKENNTRS